MDNFMFQKLMNVKKEEEKEKPQEEIEVLTEENEVGRKSCQQEEDSEGYVARKNNE